MPPATARITLPDRYRVVHHIANGGMASVWAAHDELLDRPVAVKVLASHLGEDDRARRRFAREARTAAGISHPHVVTIYDVLEIDGKSYIVMELMQGGTVADRLKSGAERSGDERAARGRISHRVALRWLQEAGSALDAAHEAGIVHRDVKPANLLLDTRRTSSAGTREAERLAIGDFGIARIGLEDQITQTGQVLGTAASDRYALAVVAFELLTGSKPFIAENFAAQARAHVDEEPPRASERDIDVPPAVDAVLARGMAKEPDERWESAGAMVRALDDALAAPPPRRRAAGADATRVMATTKPARRVGAVPPAGRGADPAPTGGAPRRRFGAGAVIALAALLLVVAGAVALATSGDDGDPGAKAERTPEPTRTAEATPDEKKAAEKTATPEATAEASPEPTATATPEATPEQEQPSESGGGSAGDDDPTALQLKAFEFNNAGKHRQALKFAERAVRACEGSTAVDPCAYALFEYAKALRLTGNPEGAIAALEERKQRFPDNQPGAVEQELALAREAAGQSD